MRRVISASFCFAVSCCSAATTVDLMCDSQHPYLNVAYSTGTDTGTPGLFWLGVVSPDQTSGTALTSTGWQSYQGGLYPFQSRYDNGLPATIKLSIPFPTDSNTTSTMAFVGYQVYVGHGVYTTAAAQLVAERRSALDFVKPQEVAAGSWSPEYDTDDRYKWSLIQQNMVESKKYGAVYTIPVFDCAQ